MFERRPDGDDAARVPITIDGAPFDARAGDTVAAALLAAGVDAFRTTALSGAPRGPYCLMGTCFECLVEIDGVPNRQACLTYVAAGMRIALGRGRQRVAEDIA
jgi:predicted molibdopterin-dependent oxidoreductase YjgC